MRVLHDDLFSTVSGLGRRQESWVRYEPKAPTSPHDEPAPTDRTAQSGKVRFQVGTNVTVTIYRDDSKLEDRYQKALRLVEFAARSEVEPSVKVKAPEAPAPQTRGVWSSIVAGISSAFGVASVRRHVESPEDTFAAIADELGRAIKDSKGRD